MSTISKMETPTGQEETAILLEEQARRIATLQESLNQAGRIHPNEAVILQEIKRVVEERDDMKRRLENLELLIERLKAREIKLKQFESSERCANKLWRGAHQGKDFWPGKTGLLMWLMEQIDNANAKQPEEPKKPEGYETLSDAIKKALKNEIEGLISNFKKNLETRRPISTEYIKYNNIATKACEDELEKLTAHIDGKTTKIDKALQNIDVTKRVLVENSCPSEFGLKDCEYNPETGCTLCCEDCWNEEVGE